jgi:two-component system CheB/CheR fusion protein
MLVRGQTGHDFSQYKKTTIRRRVERRMAVHRIASLDNYIKHIRENPREADQLYKEQLIGVTNFFRDPEAFESLKETVIPELFEKKGNQNPIRVWVPAASTGEEAYSLAILLRDYMNHSDQDHDVQIFATDLDEDAVEHARHGVFPQSVATDVPAQYLKRYFAQENSSFSVRREVRELIVFAPQNIASDPPFSRMDLISCRNLLIYLESSLQERLLWTFHYALRQGGFLFLGSSETVGKFHEQFDPIDRKWKIFRKRDQRNGAHVGPRALIPFKPKVPAPAKRVKKAPKKLENLPLQVTERHIIDKYAPPALIVNEKNRIIFIYGHAGKFIEPPAGDFTDNVVDLIKKELRLALSNTLRKVSSQGVETRSDKLFISLQGTDYIVRLLVSPITEPTDMQGHLIIFFEEKQWQGSEESDKKIHEGKEGSRKAQELEHELKSTREYLQTTIEELETSNEELQSTNEELQSSNEELQSTNEELETSKEELQSVNEELRTVNAELQQKIDELSKTSNDLNNLLASTDIGTVFLDSDMKIKRFTPKISDFINLIDTDIGRPLEHLATRLQRHDIVSFAKEVFNKLESRETEVQTDSGNWYLMRILPYRTSDNYVDGVVITFVDITSQKELERELSRMSNVFMEFPDPIIIEDTNGWVQQINNEAKEMYGWRKELIMGKDGNILVKPECQEELAEYRNMALKGLKTRNREIVRIRKNGDQVKVLTSIFALSDEKGGFEGLAFIDRALPD